MKVSEAKPALACALLDLEAAAMPTRSEVFVSSGAHARDLHDAIQTLLASHEALRLAADALQAEVERLREALAAAREGLSIAAGWARSKPDSGNARDKIKAGLEAIRFALNPRAALKGKDQ